jgi:hypothetical protein
MEGKTCSDEAGSSPVQAPHSLEKMAERSPANVALQPSSMQRGTAKGLPACVKIQPNGIGSRFSEAGRCLPEAGFSRELANRRLFRSNDSAIRDAAPPDVLIFGWIGIHFC